MYEFISEDPETNFNTIFIEVFPSGERILIFKFSGKSVTLTRFWKRICFSSLVGSINVSPVWCMINIAKTKGMNILMFLPEKNLEVIVTLMRSENYKEHETV